MTSVGDDGDVGYVGDGVGLNKVDLFYGVTGSRDGLLFIVSVKNSVANQTHPVNISLSCEDLDGDGNCFLFADDGGGLQDWHQAKGVMRVDVYTPSTVAS